MSNLNSIKKLIVIAGPTAVGKTSFAIKLAQHFNAQIISFDSRQFYKGLNIGTAQPSSEELNTVIHHFIANKEVTEKVNAGSYALEANAKIEKLFIDDDIVIMVGGSGLYIDAVLYGLDKFPEVPSEIRIQVNKDFEDFGIERLNEELQLMDPLYFKSVDRFNPQRVKRAIEIIRQTRLPFSTFLKKQSIQKKEYQVYKFCLNMYRSNLYELINLRVDLMVTNGLFEEASMMISLRNEYALKTVGYKEIFDWIDGKQSKEKTIDLIKQHTRNFAKRQVTWFKRDSSYAWLNNEDFKNVISTIEN